MKLLELLPQIKEYGRVKREFWKNKFLIRSCDDFESLFMCNLNSLIITRELLTFADLIADDWEIIE